MITLYGLYLKCHSTGPLANIDTVVVSVKLIKRQSRGWSLSANLPYFKLELNSFALSYFLGSANFDYGFKI